MRFDVGPSIENQDEHLFPATRANDLELMRRRRPGGPVVGPGASDYNRNSSVSGSLAAEIDSMLGDMNEDNAESNEYWFNSEYQARRQRNMNNANQSSNRRILGRPVDPYHISDDDIDNDI